MEMMTIFKFLNLSNRLHATFYNLKHSATLMGIDLDDDY